MSEVLYLNNEGVTMKNSTIGIYGTGNMAEALVRGIIRTKWMMPDNIIAYDPSAERQNVMKAFGITMTDDIDLPSRQPIVLFAVKPQQIKKAVQLAAHNLSCNTIAVSIAAGIQLSTLLQTAPYAKWARVMPNTPMLVGAGVSCISYDEKFRDEEKSLVKEIFSTASDVYEVHESLMDAVTAVSGSGPAYFLYMVELLADAGIKAGLPKEIAENLAVGTFYGAAKLLHETKEQPKVLRNRVTSPNGTTAAAIETFTKEGFERIINAGVLAAYIRSKQLAGE